MRIFAAAAKHLSPSATFAMAIAALAAFGLTEFQTDAASPNTAQSAAVDIFEAMEAGDIDVKLVVNDIEHARIIAKNNTKKPLTIKIPEAFAAVPVLAQNQGGGGNQGGAFNVPPEKVAKHDVGFVCLEHGKPDPRSTMQYEIKPIETMTTNPLVIELLKQLTRGRYGQQAAQAAAWHLENGSSWQQLAAKRRRQLNGTSQPYFTPAEMQQAVNIVTDVNRIVARQQSSDSDSLAD